MSMRPFLLGLLLFFTLPYSLSQAKQESHNSLPEQPKDIAPEGDFASPQSRISLGVNGDSSETKTFSLDASISVAKGVQLLVGATRTKGALVEEVDPSSTSVLLGISTAIAEGWTLTGYYDRWGQSENLISQGAVASLAITSGDWSFGVDTAYKRIDLRTNNNFVNTISSRLGGFLSYYGLGPFGISIAHTGYRYQDDLTRLNSDIAQFLVPLTVISLSSSFLDSQSSATVSWAWNWLWVDVDGSKSVSAVDKSTTTSATLRIGIDYFTHWGFEIEGGQSKTEGSTTKSTFAGLTINYLW